MLKNLECIRFVNTKTFAKFSFPPLSQKNMQIMFLATSMIIYALNMLYQIAFPFQLVYNHKS
jgi:hypothetical protein